MPVCILLILFIDSQSLCAILTGDEIEGPLIYVSLSLSLSLSLSSCLTFFVVVHCVRLFSRHCPTLLAPPYSLVSMVEHLWLSSV